MMYLMKIYGLVSFYLFDTNLKMVISRFSKIFFPNASEYFLILLISHGVYNFFFSNCLRLSGTCVKFCYSVIDDYFLC